MNTPEYIRGAVRAPADPTVSQVIADSANKYPQLLKHRTAIERLGSQFTYVKPIRHRNSAAGKGSDMLFCLLRFSAGIESVFGLTREVAIYYSPYTDLQNRTLSEIRRHMSDNPRDVTPDIVLLSAPDGDLERKCDEWSTPGLTIIPLSDCSDVSPGDCSTQIINTLSTRIFRRDLFAETAPVFGPRFFGRQLVLGAIENDIRSRTAAAVFGLRKTGKTSLLYQLRHRFETSNSGQTVFILQDLESLPSPENRPIGDLILDLQDKLQERISTLGADASFLERISVRPTVPEFKRAVLRTIGEAGPELQIVLALDEIEYLCPPQAIVTTIEGGEEIPQFLGALRSIQQETNNFTFLLSGLGTALVDSSQLFGRTNPLFAWAKKYFLAPFTLTESTELVREIGYRMGTDWDDASVKELFERTQGHPFLLRSLASTIAMDLPILPARRRVFKSNLDRLIPSWERSVAATKEAMLSDFERHYPDAWELVELSVTDARDFMAYADLVPNAMEQLLGLGLFERANRSECTPTGLLSVLQRKHAR